MEPQKTQTVAYLRVSLEKMAERGLSLETQREKVTSYAQLYDLDLVEIIVDAGVSAKTLDRPGLNKALSMLRNGSANALLIVKLDRLCRSVKDLGQLIEDYFASGKSALLSVTEQVDTRSASGRLVLNLLSSVAQWERETIGERTSAVMQHKISQKEYIGGKIPFGFRLAQDGKNLEPNESEQRAVLLARKLRGENLSYREIARELAKVGVFSRNGKPFQAIQVKRLQRSSLQVTYSLTEADDLMANPATKTVA